MRWGRLQTPTSQTIFLDKFDPAIRESILTHIQNYNGAIKNSKVALILITTQQGAGKTTAEKEVFKSRNNVILLTKSNQRARELASEISEESPETSFDTIYSLEASCITYQSNSEELAPVVQRYRGIGIFPRNIHHMICNNALCEYSEQSPRIRGRVITTFDMFLHLKSQIGAYQYYTIFLDEGDGLLNRPLISLEPEIFRKFKFKEIYSGDDYLPHIYEWEDLNIRDPSEDIQQLCEVGDYSSSLPGLKSQLQRMIFTDGAIDNRKIAENIGYIRNLKKLIDVLEARYFSYYNNKRTGKTEVYLPPPIFELGLFLLTHPNVTMVASSASLRPHRYRFMKIMYYFELARYMLMDGFSEKFDHLDGSRLNRELFIFDHLENSKPPQEYKGDFSAKETLLINRSFKTQSVSKNHYSILGEKGFQGHLERNGRISAERKRTKIQKEIINELTSLISLYEKISGRLTKKVLLITFEEGARFIDEYREELKRKIQNYWKKYKDQRDVYNVLKKIDARSWFSPKWHGMNFNRTHDLILLIGDPIENEISRFLTKKDAVGVTRKGFALKEDSPLTEAERDMINVSILTELMEAIHRSRGDLDVIYVGNLLEPENPIDRQTRHRVLLKDNVKFKTMGDWTKEYTDSYVRMLRGSLK